MNKITIDVRGYRDDIKTKKMSIFSNDPHGDQKYVRATTPNINALSPLARFLVENVADNVSDIYGDREKLVRLYNGKTQAEMLLKTVNTPAELALAKREIQAYTLDEKKAVINEFVFPKIVHWETDEAYWESVARYVIELGAKTVVINDNEFTVVTK